IFSYNIFTTIPNVNIVIATVPAKVPNPNIYVAIKAMINVGKVLVILKTILTIVNTIFDLLILTEDIIANGIAIRLPIIDPNND
ncbi:MAG TPA: hypothetical protein DCM59_04970, partial [Clostridium sp.]|nr:hypothetical protein [Clostridium sp.]